MSLKDTPRLLLESLFDAWQSSDFEEMAALVQPRYLKILDRHELGILERISNTLGLTTFGAYNIKSISQGLFLNMQDADISFHLKQGGAVVGLTAAAQSIMTVEF